MDDGFEDNFIPYITSWCLFPLQDLILQLPGKVFVCLLQLTLWVDIKLPQDPLDSVWRPQVFQFLEQFARSTKGEVGLSEAQVVFKMWRRVGR